MAYQTYFGFVGVDAPSAIQDRNGNSKFRFFRALPSMEQIKAAYDMPPCDKEEDQKLFDNAIETMLEGETGYYYGMVFIMKDISFED